jgi:hypothetical protein
MTSQVNHTQATTIQIALDRLSVCFTDPNYDNVKGTCGLLLSDHYMKTITGMKVNANARYAVQARIPMPFMSDGVDKHPICFEAGPKHEGLPSYRLDFNPAKLSAEGIDQLKVLLDSIIDATPQEFFSEGRVTRVDVAVDLVGPTVDHMFVLTERKQKHGVYSNRYGVPETVYLGTPRSSRVVAYTKVDNTTGTVGTRLECRLKPKCCGKNIVELKNPLAKMKLLSVAVLNGLALGFPAQLLADSIRLRGVKRAIAILSAEQRKLISKALASSESLLPNPEELWAGWPDALMKVGLGKELGVALQNAVPKAA